MGKVPNPNAAATAVMKGKRKPRHSHTPLPFSTPSKSPLPNCRSTRRNPSLFNSPEFDDDEDERKQKKVKLVVRLPQSDDKSEKNSDSGSGSDSDQESEDREGCAKNRGSDDGGLDQDKEAVKETDSHPLNGSSLKSGPTTPLPEKKLLVFILDRLQKKDTHRVFSEPVDPDELPDYFDIIEQPMDFGTVRKKLDNGAYKNLEDLEADVLLICSNAMQYNSSNTVFYRQARTIQELAKRDFQNLKHEGEDGAPQPKVVRRGRPPSIKNQKKSLETSPVDGVDHVGTAPSSDATPASVVEDRAAGSNSYNLRKPAFIRTTSSDPYVSAQRSRNGENCSEWSTDWNNEFPASILRADMKYGKKQFVVDENKRDTYRQSLALGNSLPILSNSFGNMKRLVPVGLQEPLAYARSLARFAATLGPVAWKVASKKIEAVLPAGVEYGPGWVGDNELPSQSLQKSSITGLGECNTSEGVVRKLKSENELAGQSDAALSWRTPFPAQPNPMRNGFTGMYGYGEPSSSHSSAMNPVVPDGLQSGSYPQMAKGLILNSSSNPETEMWNVEKFRQALAAQQRQSNPSIPPDLNVRVPAGSPSSSLQIGSPRQPDLALQL